MAVFTNWTRLLAVPWTRRCLYVSFLANIFSGCTSARVTFVSEEIADVSLFEFAQPDAQGEAIGRTPITVDAERLVGKVVRVQKEGRMPILWYFTELHGESNRISMKFDSVTSITAGAPTNQTYRILMKSYQALLRGQYDVAKRLATRLGEIVPNISAPFIIKGLVALKEGDSKEAKLNFTEAKALDPEDKDIDQLLGAIK